VLWLHFGMPKTGSTALQNFLSVNHAEMDASGLRYMIAGRARPDGAGRPTSSHNQMVFDITKGGAHSPFYRQAIAAEYQENTGKTCLVSSEMFYSTRHDDLARIFADIPRDEMRILLYCRRYDDYFEAEYKQHAKNGKIALGATQHIKNRLTQIKDSPEKFNFSGRVSRIRAAFPDVPILPKIYDRAQLTNGNLVDDVLDQVGVRCPDSLSTEANSNASLSRIGSEAFGVITRVIGRQPSRRLRRLISSDPVMLRKHDVLEIEERTFINEHLAATDEDFRKEFFPDSATLFPTRQASDEMVSYRRDTPQDLEDMKLAMEHVVRLALEAGPDVLATRDRRRRRARAKERATQT